MMPVPPSAIDSVRLLHLGEFLPPVLAAAAYLGLYAKRARTLAGERRSVAGWRWASFAAGVLMFAVVQLPPIDGLADEVLAVHMVQHILIGEVATLLIVLGLTGPVIAPLLRIRVTRPLRTLANPITAFGLWALNLYLWHTPLLYQLAIRYDLVHALEHACLLWFGALLWLALIGPLPKPAWFRGWAELGYVFLVRGAGAVLGNVMIWTQTVIYPVYRASDGARGLNPISDQNLAGAAMMVEQMLLTALIVGWLFIRFARREEEQQRVLDLARERGLDVSEERAARAAGAGAAARLRRRLLEESGGLRGAEG
jgi:cytochrome c oxidase assembly factor CtaG